jgi:hypothetical protein
VAQLLQQDENSPLVAAIYHHPLISSLYPGAYDPKSGELPSYIPSRNFALAILDYIQHPDELEKEINKAAQSMGTKVEKLPSAEDLKRVVQRVTGTATENVEEIRDHLEQWFNSSMDRVSGWFKRHTHERLLIIGLVLAAYMNVDSIFMAKHLLSDKAARLALVSAATEYAKDDGTSSSSTPAEKRIDLNLARIENLGLPIGWNRARLPKPAWPPGTFDRETTTSGLWKIAVLVPGWLITALAVSLGAPFWFDMLNKIIVVRSTVKPKEKSGTEAPKEPQAKEQ